MERLRLLLVDDHVLFRQSLKRLLDSEEGIEVVADCGTTEEAFAVLNRDAIDVVLLDYDLGHDQATKFIGESSRIGSPVKILMVTAGMSAAESASALRLGVAGIFLKRGAPKALVQAIRLVAEGASWVDPHILQHLAAQVEEPRSPSPKPQLTEREEHVLQGVFEGLANKEIGARLGASETAIKATLQQLFRKARVRTRGQLVRVVLEGSLTTKRKV